MPTTWVTEYAKSARATCKGCKDKIGMGELRIGSQNENADGQVMTRWFHPKCFNKPKAMEDVDQLQGLDKVTQEDQAFLRDEWFTGEAQAKAKAEGTPVKRKAEEPAKAKKGKKAKGPEIEITKADPKPQVEAPEDPRAAALEAKYKSLTNEELKKWCACNGQLLGGKKDDLVARCVDGELYGGLPECPLCKKAIVRVEYTEADHGGQGLFTCPGFNVEGQSFKCKFTAETMVRVPWKEMDPTADYSSKKKERKVPDQPKPEDDPKAAASVGAKDAANELVARARAAGISINPDSTKARVECGPILLQHKTEDGLWDYKGALDQLADLKGMESKAAGGEGGEEGPPNHNPVLSALFDELSGLEKHAAEGNTFKAGAYKKVSIALRMLPYKVTSGKALLKKDTKVEGIGKASAEKIDEWLETGKISKLEEYRAAVNS